MATSADIAAAVDQFRTVVNNMGWEIQATDLRGEEVIVNVARPKDTIGAGGAVVEPAQPAQSAGQ